MIQRLLRRRQTKLAVRAVIRALRLLTPRRDHVVVTGYPDSEGNAVEVVRRLLERGEAPVVWLVDSPVDAARLVAPVAGLRVLPKASPAAFRAYLTARLVFFTHGLYLSPPPSRRKPVVNLWHGDGPKAPLHDSSTIRPRASLLVSGTRRFGAIKAGFLHVPPPDLLVVGNPRWDELARPATDDELSRLALDPSRALLLFMPTFRRSRAVGSRVGWSDTDAQGSSASGPTQTEMLAGLAAGASAVGAQVVVKPHPLDAEDHDVPGVRTLTTDDLDQAGVALYRLLGRTDALVTDFSSVWTDFLTLDRPLGFVLHDREAYERGSRGLNIPDLDAVLPGPALHTPDDCRAFVVNAVEDPAATKEQRAASAEAIGLARPAGSATDALLDELVARGVL